MTHANQNEEKGEETQLDRIERYLKEINDREKEKKLGESQYNEIKDIMHDIMLADIRNRLGVEFTRKDKSPLWNLLRFFGLNRKENNCNETPLNSKQT